MQIALKGLEIFQKIYKIFNKTTIFFCKIAFTSSFDDVSGTVCSCAMHN